MPDINIGGLITYENAANYKLELSRSQKGTYAWTITAHGDTPSLVIDKTTALDKALRMAYLPIEEPEKEGE